MKSTNPNNPGPFDREKQGGQGGKSGQSGQGGRQSGGGQGNRPTTPTPPRQDEDLDFNESGGLESSDR